MACDDRLASDDPLPPAKSEQFSLFMDAIQDQEAMKFPNLCNADGWGIALP